MNKFNITIVIIAIALLLITNPSKSETFCITNSAELHNALFDAANNAEDDHIKIMQGSYTPLFSTGFSYETSASENYELKITGGWATFFGNLCGHQPTKSPFTTTLNANFLGPVLTIKTIRFTDVVVSSLQFRNGFNDSVTQGAGLIFINDVNYFGDVLIENCAFFNNESTDSSALIIFGGSHVVVRNNLFAFNHSEISSSIFLIMLNGINPPNNDRGIYFTNNTVVANTNDNTSNYAHTSGLYLHVAEYSQAYIANNIFWDNDVNDLFLSGPGYKYFVNNDFKLKLGLADLESNNLSINPQFEPGLFNYNLSQSSVLIDAGIKPPLAINNPPNFDETWSLGELDISDNERIQFGQVDIGAFESPYDYSDVLFENDFENIN